MASHRPPPPPPCTRSAASRPEPGPGEGLRSRIFVKGRRSQILPKSKGCTACAALDWGSVRQLEAAARPDLKKMWGRQRLFYCCVQAPSALKASPSSCPCSPARPAAAVRDLPPTAAVADHGGENTWSVPWNCGRRAVWRRSTSPLVEEVERSQPHSSSMRRRADGRRKSGAASRPGPAGH